MIADRIPPKSSGPRDSPAPPGARREELRGPEAERRYALWFAAILASSFVFRLLYSGWVELTGDELMHWQWSRHLALGYPEHPPLIAWSIAAITRAFGTSERTVRLVSVVAMTVALGVAFRLARELYGARAAFYCVGALLITPIAAAGGVLATTDALLTCFWTLTAYTVKKAVLDGRTWAWPAAGLAAGLALLSKLPAILLVPAVALVLVATAEGRSQLRRAGPYVAALLAVLVFLPDLIWNSRHGWVTLLMRVGYKVSPQFTLRPLGELFAMQLVAVSPVFFAGFLWALVACWRRRSDARAVLLGSFAAVPFLFYAAYSLHAAVDNHRPAVGYMTGFVALGAFALERRPSRAVVIAAVAPCLVITGLLYLVPLRPSLIAFSWSYSKKFGTSRLNDIVDWKELGAAIAPLVERDPGRTFLLCHDGYSIAGLASFYTRGRPPVFLWQPAPRNGAAYDTWKAESDLRGWSAVIVDDRWHAGFFDAVRPSFESLSPPIHVTLERDGRILREFDLAVATGFRGFPGR